MREIIIILAILITLPILLNFFAGYFKIKRFGFYDIKDQGTNPQCFLELVKGLYLHKKIHGKH